MNRIDRRRGGSALALCTMLFTPLAGAIDAQAVQTGFGSDDCEYEFNFDFDIPGGGGGGDCNTISLVTNIVGVTFTAPPGTGTLDFTPSAYDQDTCTLTLDATLDIPEYPDPTDEVRFCARLTSKTMISDVPNRVWRYNWVSVEWDLGSSSWVDSGASFGVAYNKAENIYRGERHQGLAMECPPDQMIVEIGQTPAGHFYFSRDLPHTFLVRIAATVVLTEGDAITAPVYAYSVEDVCDGEPLANSNVTPLPTIYSLPVGAHTPPNPGDLIQASWVPSGAGGAPLITITDAYEKPVVLVCDEPGGLNFQNPDNAIQWWWVGGWV